MPTFFAQSIDQDLAAFHPEDARHVLSALRMKQGEGLQIAYLGKRYEARLEKQENEWVARLLSPLPDSEPRLKVTLYLGLTKGEKMDFAVQKCTELGASRIVPCLFSRCVAKWEGGDKKLLRLQRIAREAAVQSGRGMIPVVDDCLDLSALSKALLSHEQALLPWENGGMAMKDALTAQRDLSLVIGPEGGIATQEVQELSAAIPITLGPRILRAETAAMAALTMALTLSGDMT